MPRGKKREDCDIDLGLAISALTLRYGQTRTQKELAAYCGCSQQAIYEIERKAMRRIRMKLGTDPELSELVHSVGLT